MTILQLYIFVYRGYLRVMIPAIYFQTLPQQNKHMNITVGGDPCRVANRKPTLYTAKISEASLLYFLC